MKNYVRIGAVGLFGLMTVLALGGCASGPESRIEKHSAAFAAMPVVVQEKIKAGEIEMGFTPLQVTLARGKPDKVGKRTSAGKQEDVWTYERRRSGLGFGLGLGGGSGGMGGGVGVSTGGQGSETALKVFFADGVVKAAEYHSL